MSSTATEKSAHPSDVKSKKKKTKSSRSKSGRSASKSAKSSKTSRSSRSGLSQSLRQPKKSKKNSSAKSTKSSRKSRDKSTKSAKSARSSKSTKSTKSAKSGKSHSRHGHSKKRHSKSFVDALNEKFDRFLTEMCDYNLLLIFVLLFLNSITEICYLVAYTIEVYVMMHEHSIGIYLLTLTVFVVTIFLTLESIFIRTHETCPIIMTGDVIFLTVSLIYTYKFLDAAAPEATETEKRKAENALHILMVFMTLATVNFIFVALWYFRLLKREKSMPKVSLKFVSKTRYVDKADLERQEQQQRALTAFERLIDFTRRNYEKLYSKKLDAAMSPSFTATQVPETLKTVPSKTAIAIPDEKPMTSSCRDKKTCPETPIAMAPKTSSIPPFPSVTTTMAPPLAKTASTTAASKTCPAENVMATPQPNACKVPSIPGQCGAPADMSGCESNAGSAMSASGTTNGCAVIPGAAGPQMEYMFARRPSPKSEVNYGGVANRQQ